MTRINKKDVLFLLPKLAKDRTYLKYVKNEVENAVDNVKKNILQDFEQHPVTLEIEQGIASENISGTLNGITNLFSFIGFNSSDKPLEPIRNLLKQINIVRSISAKGQINYRIEFPNAEDIFSVTPLPWATGRSWAKGIERGISGIGYYLKIVENSRSGLGIQSSNTVRKNIRFKNIKYISALINKYVKDIKKIEKQIL